MIVKGKLKIFVVHFLCFSSALWKLVANSSYGRTSMDVERHTEHRFTQTTDQLYKHGFMISSAPLSGEFETDWFESTFKKRRNINKVPGDNLTF